MLQCSLSACFFSSVSSCKADAKLLSVLLIMETDIKPSFSQEEVLGISLKLLKINIYKENVYSLHYQQHNVSSLITPFIFLLFSAKYLSFFHAQLCVLCEHFNKSFQRQKHIFFQTETSLLGIWSRNIALNSNILNFLGMFFWFYVAKSCHNYSSVEAPHFSLQRNFCFYDFSLQMNNKIWNYFREN